MNYNQTKKHILDTGKYMTLATASADGEPWASPLAFVYDGDKYFYFISNNSVRHAKNIAENPRVAFAVFDSLQSSGNAFGLQWAGIAEKMITADVPSRIKTDLFALVSMVVLNREYSFFRIAITEMYLPHAERWKDDKPLRILVMGKESEKENQD